jgi:ADP-ribose pyrophosphatase
MDPNIKVIRSQIIYQAKYFSVVEEEVEILPERIVKRAIVKHPGAVVVIPVDAEGKLLLVKQFRLALRDSILEFPAGTLETGEDPIECAKREIAEEVAHSASEWTHLGTLIPAPGFCNEIQHLFLAKGLTHSPGTLDEDEIIEVVPLTCAQVEDAIMKNELNDGKSIAAYMRAKLLGLL